MEITLAPDASPWNEIDGDTQCFSVFAKNDDIKEHLYENFCVEFVAYDDCVHIEENVTEVVMSEDDDAIEAGFTSGYHVVEEDDDCRPNTVEVCVNSTGQIEKPIPFYVEFFSGTAKENQDFYTLEYYQYFEEACNGNSVILGVNAAYNNTLTNVSQCFNITIAPDTILELKGNESDYMLEEFKIGLVQNPHFNVIPERENCTVFILDNDYVSVSFEEERYTLPESNSDGTDGNISVCLKLYGKTQRPVTVYVSTNDDAGTVIVGSDYYAISNMSILLAPDASPWQEVNEDTQCFDVFARNDDSVENNETFYVRIVGYDDCVDVCSAESAIIIHEDSDAVNISFVDEKVFVNESSTCVDLCVEVFDVVERDVEVIVRSASGSFEAEEGKDFKLTEEVLTFQPGVSSVLCVQQVIVNDVLVEEDVERFQATLTSNDSAVNVTEDKMCISILDDDEVVLCIEEEDLNLEVEEGGFVSVCVSVIHGSCERDVVVTLETEAGTATEDIDFCLQQNNLTFTMDNAAMSQCRRFQTKSDTALEDTEKFYVRLLSSDSSVVIKNAKASIEIIDTNNGVLAYFTEDKLVVYENDTVATVCVNVSANSPLERNITLSVQKNCKYDINFLSYDTVIEDLVFSELGTKCAGFEISDNDLVNEKTFFTLSLSTCDSFVTVKNTMSKVHVVVKDDEVAVIGLSVASSNIIEDDEMGNGAVIVACVNLTDGKLNRTIAVTAYTENGTAREQIDYYSDLKFENEKAKFLFSPPGDPYRGKRDLPAVSGDHCFSIHIMADDIMEETETFTVRLYTSEKHGVILYPAIVEIAIIDNDDVSAAFKQTKVSIMEGMNFTICINYYGMFETSATVNVMSEDGSATGAQDYDDVNQQITLAEGAGPFNQLMGGVVCVALSAHDDDIVEGTHNFSIHLNSSDSCVKINNSVLSICILDDDSIVIEHTEADYAVLEGVMFDLLVRFTGCLERSVQYRATTADITALGSLLGGTDYNSFDRLLTFGSSASQDNIVCDESQSITLEIREDNKLEYVEHLLVTLNSTDTAASIPNPVATVNITDNTTLQASLDRAGYEVVEEAGELEVTVSLTGGSLERPVFVSFTTMNGSAIAGEDYVAVNQQLEFGSTASPFNCSCVNTVENIPVNVSIIDDPSDEENENFFINLNAASDAGIDLSTSQAEVVIVDDNDDGLEIYFINDTPMVEGRTITLSLEFSHTVSEATCRLEHNSDEDQTTDCTNGNVVFSGLGRQMAYTVFVSATSAEDGSVANISRFISAIDRRQCSAHLINEGVLIFPPINLVVVEFELDGHTSDEPPLTATCSLDDVELPSCVSPLFLMDVTEGNHSLTVLVNQPSEGSTCRRIRSFNVDFTVESESDELSSPPEITFTDDTPMVETRDIRVNVSYDRSVSGAVCLLEHGRGNEYIICTSGNADIAGRRNRRFDVTLSVYAITRDGSIGSVSRDIPSLDGPHCGVHLINEGIVVTGNSVTIMFEKDGPNRNSIHEEDTCEIVGNGGPIPCTSPYVVPNLSTGQHTMIIRPVQRTQTADLPDLPLCRRLRSLEFTFDV